MRTRARARACVSRVLRQARACKRRFRSRLRRHLSQHRINARHDAATTYDWHICGAVHRGRICLAETLCVPTAAERPAGATYQPDPRAARRAWCRAAESGRLPAERQHLGRSRPAVRAALQGWSARKVQLHANCSFTPFCTRVAVAHALAVAAAAVPAVSPPRRGALGPPNAAHAWLRRHPQSGAQDSHQSGRIQAAHGRLPILQPRTGKARLLSGVEPTRLIFIDIDHLWCASAQVRVRCLACLCKFGAQRRRGRLQPARRRLESERSPSAGKLDT